jgi:hypothetical protein
MSYSIIFGVTPLITLEGRLVEATLGGFTRSVLVSRGCPQEGVLLPLVWCLVVNELLARLNGGGAYSQGYADDICLLAVGIFPNTVSGLIQWALHTIEMWCDELGLSVNPEKTGLVAFTRRRKFPGFFEPRLFGTTLTPLHVSQVSGSDPGFMADLEGARGC